ncbi:MAG TPA: hypothetical protein VK686_14335 [Bryobacteraceae bacterium]|jgi:hypothetical protein|nr:hypothetical protein [Bryobacteraceae bacterium]
MALNRTRFVTTHVGSLIRSTPLYDQPLRVVWPALSSLCTCGDGPLRVAMTDTNAFLMH